MATASNTPTIDVKTAVRIATSYFDQLIQRPYSDLAIEEVERTDDDRYWLVTVGYTVTPAGLTSFAALQKEFREYKIVKVDAQNGQAVSMKVRKLF